MPRAGKLTDYLGYRSLASGETFIILTDGKHDSRIAMCEVISNWAKDDEISLTREEGAEILAVLMEQ